MPLVIALSKIIFRHSIKAKLEIQKQGSVDEKLKYTEAIKQEWKEYNKIDGSDCFFSRFNKMSMERPSFPDAYFANIISEFENDPDVYFVPETAYKSDINLSSRKDQLDTQVGIDYLTECLINGFNSGKEIVIFRISSKDTYHTALGAFKSNGEYIIIDSMLNMFDINTITHQLNNKKIKSCRLFSSFFK